MKKFLILALVFQGFSLAHASVLPLTAFLSPAHGLNVSGIVTDLVVCGYHQTSWPPMSGTGNYNLSVVNLSTGQTHCFVSTPNTSTLIAGLTTGTYRFVLNRGGTTIIDIIDIG